MVSLAPETTPLNLLRCVIGSEVYGLDMRHVHSIQRADRLQLQAGPGGQLGLIRLQDESVPVFGLAQCLGRSPSPIQAMQPIVMLSSPAGRWGLLTDRLAQVLRADAGAFWCLPRVLEESCGHCLEGVAQDGKGMLLVLKVAGMQPTGDRDIRTDVLDPRVRGRAIALPAEMPATTGSKHLILCRTQLPEGRQRPLALGFGASQVLEVLQTQVLQSVPLAPTEVLGLLGWRNMPVPVIDLAFQLGLPPSPRNALHRVLVTRVADQPVGVAITTQVRVLRLPVAHQPGVKLPLRTDLVRRVFELKTETVIIPDMNALCGHSSPPNREVAPAVHLEAVAAT